MASDSQRAVTVYAPDADVVVQAELAADVNQLPFAARLAAADSEAVGELAAFLTRAVTPGSRA
ncbi:hypothetical protein [Streptomyces sp. NPDC056883]|uniref:hypothetical protein n=1 Tax=Streptomyces sp. NPDC056883 TaxID=3345959 RepID=UPI0036D0EC4A